ncbi:MAG: tRNA (adenosine(37)-N6)-threonylcarbamoyltransferase complex dimerization subunit type 1 TsaB [Myxococcales bacterium]|nr:tRNA (adenosine(37)-N6)-threonylcarbamoyltransferase complex dimerization subunit type 1 TsaB [Myxococcales bacterium]
MRQAVRILAIETSSRRGSVALLEDSALVARATHTEVARHAERIAPLLDRVLSEAAWTRASIERVAVGMGPGSFTGLRVGIAFARGIQLGLGIPLIGVGSLEAMAELGPEGRARVALLDARRDEIFAQAFGPDGAPLSEPEALPRANLASKLEARFPDAIWLGEIAKELGFSACPHQDELSALPDAVGVGRIAARRSVEASLEQPLYVRDAGASPQSLPPSPIRE